MIVSKNINETSLNNDIVWRDSTKCVTPQRDFDEILYFVRKLEILNSSRYICPDFPDIYQLQYHNFVGRYNSPSAIHLKNKSFLTYTYVY